MSNQTKGTQVSSKRYNLSGIILITGEVNVGKTSAAHPAGYSLKEIAYLNFDGKEPDFSGGNAADFYGFYRNYYELLLREKELKTIETFLNDVESLPKTIKVVIVDGEEQFRKSFTPYTIKHKENLRDYWYGRGGQMQVMEVLGFSSKFEAMYFSSLQEKYDFVFIINHLEDARSDEKGTDGLRNLIPGKKTASVKRQLIEKSKARFWIVPTDGHLCPSVIMVKNPGLVIPENGFKTISPFPPKLSPFALPDYSERKFISIWDIIKYYEENPFSEKYPSVESYEVLTQKEREMVSEDITESDLSRMKDYATIINNNNKFRLISAIEDVLKENKKYPALAVWAKIKSDFPDMEFEEAKVLIEELKN